MKITIETTLEALVEVLNHTNNPEYASTVLSSTATVPQFKPIPGREIYEVDPWEQRIRYYESKTRFYKSEEENSGSNPIATEIFTFPITRKESNYCTFDEWKKERAKITQTVE